MQILQMMAAFRQLRPAASEQLAPPPPPPPPDTESEVKEESAGTPPPSMEALMDQKMRELETQMRSYIDAKVKEVVHYIEANFERKGTNLISDGGRNMVAREREGEVSSGEGTQNRTQNKLLDCLD